jgi:hypothetical protein
MFQISEGIIAFIRHMPVEMEIKERVLRALAGRQHAGTAVAKIADALREAQERGEDLEFWSRNTLPQLIEETSAPQPSERV